MRQDISSHVQCTCQVISSLLRMQTTSVIDNIPLLLHSATGEQLEEQRSWTAWQADWPKYHHQEVHACGQENHRDIGEDYMYIDRYYWLHSCCYIDTHTYNMHVRSGACRWSMWCSRHSRTQIKPISNPGYYLARVPSQMQQQILRVTTWNPLQGMDWPKF